MYFDLIVTDAAEPSHPLPVGNIFLGLRSGADCDVLHTTGHQHRSCEIYCAVHAILGRFRFYMELRLSLHLLQLKYVAQSLSRPACLSPKESPRVAPTGCPVKVCFAFSCLGTNKHQRKEENSNRRAYREYLYSVRAASAQQSKNFNEFPKE